jgi:TonB family protein
MNFRALLLLLCVASLDTSAAQRAPDAETCGKAMEADRLGDAAGAAALQLRCIDGLGTEGRRVEIATWVLAIFYSRAGQHAEAIAAFDRVAALQGQPSPRLLTHRGREKLEIEQDEGARADFESALAIDADFGDASFGLGLLLEHEGKRDEARTRFLHAFNHGERSVELLQRARDYDFTAAEMPTRMEPPKFPAAALRKCVHGDVRLQYTTDASGLVVAVDIKQSSGDAELDRAAVEAVRMWNIRHELEDGSYVGATYARTLTFTDPCEEPENGAVPH